MSVTERIKDAIGWAEGDPSGQRTVDLLWALARFTLPAVIVEAGTHHGHTALALADALESAGAGGHVWTADPIESGVLGFAERLGLAKRITYFRGDFLDMMPSVPDDIGFAYLDAGPDTDGMRWAHFQGIRNKMAPGGIVAIDDTAGTWPHVEDFRALSCYFPQHRGLSLWQRPL